MLDRLIGERYRQHRYRVGYRDGMAEARQKAHLEGATEMHQLWEEWFERFRAAQEAGEEFSEPQPPRPHSAGKDGRAAGNAPGGQAVG